MADRYWVGGSDTWDTTAGSKWATTSGGAGGASAPGSSDQAIFDAASGAVTVTLDAGVSVGALTMTGFTGTLAYGTNRPTLTGSGYTILFTGATTYSVTGTPAIDITSGSANRTASCGAVTAANAVSVNLVSGTGILTVTGSMKNLNCTGFAGTLANSTRTIYGNLTAVSTATYAAGSNATTFAATSGTQVITSNGVTLSFTFTVNAPGATVQLADALNIGDRNFIHTAGGLDLNGKNLTCATFDSNNSNTRSITSGVGQFYCTYAASSGTAVPWTASTVTGLTLVDRPTANLTGNGSGTAGRGVQCGAVGEAVAPDVNVIAGTDSITTAPTGANFHNVNFTGFSGTLGNTSRTLYGNLTLSPTMACTAGTAIQTFAATSGTQVITSNGVTLDFPITVAAVGGTVQLADALTMGSTRTFTLTNGSLDLNGFNLTTGLFSSSNSNVRSITSGGGQFYLTGTSGNVWLTGTVTNLTLVDTPTINFAAAISSGTVTFSGSSALAAININVSAGSGTAIWDTSTSCVIGNLNFSGYSGQMSNKQRYVGGNITLSPTMTCAAGANILYSNGASGTQVITSNGLTLDFPITKLNAGATLQLADALTMGAGRALTLTAGTFDANNKNVTTGNFTAGAGATTRVTSMGTGTWTILDAGATAWSTPAAASHTVTPSTSTILMTAATAKTFAGGGRTFWNLSNGGAGALTITGANTFNDLQNTVTPATFTLPASTTTTVSALSLQGTSGNLVTLQSSSAGTRATLSKASGTVDVSYLSIKDSAATGGATWQAKPHNGNLDAGNNTGWTFPYDTVAAASMAMTAYAPGVEINVPVPLASMTLTAHLPSVEIIIPVPLAAMVMTAYAPTFEEEFLGSLLGVVRVRPALSGKISIH